MKFRSSISFVRFCVCLFFGQNLIQPQIHLPAANYFHFSPVEMKCLWQEARVHEATQASNNKRTRGLEAQWPIGYGVELRIKRSSVRFLPWPLLWVLGQGSLLLLAEGEAFTLASISYLAVIVKYILACPSGWHRNGFHKYTQASHNLQFILKRWTSLGVRGQLLWSSACTDPKRSILRGHTETTQVDFEVDGQILHHEIIWSPW